MLIANNIFCKNIQLFQFFLILYFIYYCTYWNHIPAAIKVPPSLDSFKRHLKTTILPLHNFLTA